MTQLSEHFSLEEFTRSDAAQRMDPPNANAPTKAHLANLTKVLAPGMETVRSILGDRHIFVSSAYRNPVVNHAVGGVPDSAHAMGLACDFIAIGLLPNDAAKLLIASDLKFDQLIHEVSRGILHISFDPRFRQQILTQALGPGTAVTTGIA